MIASKKKFLNQWQEINCTVNVNGDPGILPKSQAVIRKALVRFDEKSEEGNCATQIPSVYLSRIVNRVVLSYTKLFLVTP